MEEKSFGSFLAKLRKEKGITQQQLAEVISVSNKTISKWERNDGYPEVTVLPEIARFFNVSIDELLLGERHEEIKKEAAEEIRIRALNVFLKKELSRFISASAVSVFLGMISCLMAFVAQWGISKNSTREIVLIVFIVVSLLAMLIEIISFIAVKGQLQPEDKDNKREAVVSEKPKVAKLFSLSVFFSVTAVLFLFVVFWNEFPVFSMAPPCLMFALAAAVSVWLLLKKHLGIFEDEKTILAEEYRLMRKKALKYTAAFSVVVVIISALAPFLSVGLEALSPDVFSFKEAVGYQFETLEEAETEYFKLKAYVKNEKMLYAIEYEEGLTLYLRKLPNVFEKTSDNCYQMYGYIATISDEGLLEKTFKNEKEKQEFIKNNVWNEENFMISSLRNNIVFDDSSLSVRSNAKKRWSQAFDIMPVFLLGGSVIVFLAVSVSFLVCLKRRKRLNNN